MRWQGEAVPFQQHICLGQECGSRLATQVVQGFHIEPVLQPHQVFRVRHRDAAGACIRECSRQEGGGMLAAVPTAAAAAAACPAE